MSSGSETRVSDLVKLLPAHTGCSTLTPSPKCSGIQTEKQAFKTGLEALSVSVMCGAHGTRQLVRERVQIYEPRARARVPAHLSVAVSPQKGKSLLRGMGEGLLPALKVAADT